jgi:hypothetical protein
VEKKGKQRKEIPAHSCQAQVKDEGESSSLRHHQLAELGHGIARPTQEVSEAMMDRQQQPSLSRHWN